MITSTLRSILRTVRKCIGTEEIKVHTSILMQRIEHLMSIARTLETSAAQMHSFRTEMLELTGWTEKYRASAPHFQVHTKHPFATDSNDFKKPRGSRKDNTRCIGFVRRCEEIFGRKVSFLDLGCAGGGLVYDFIFRNNRAIGIDGSDYPLLNQSFEWSIIQKSLFCADITERIEIIDIAKNTPAQFDIISSWEVLEHIPEHKLPILFENILSHLSADGIFAASVATFDDQDQCSGVIWHQTVRPYAWWRSKLEGAGFILVEDLFAESQLPRGAGNGSLDWSATKNPELGFHIFARKKF